MRARTGWGVGLAIFGVLLIAAAAILAWVVVPNRKQLPADTNTTRNFTGTAKVLLNPQAVASGDLRNAIVTNAPVTAQRVVKAQATDGSAAEVSDDRTVATATGTKVGSSSVMYAVDRKTLEATTNYPSGWQVTPHQGLTVSWPIGAQKQDYTGWVNETQTTVPIRYDREETKDGVNTYVYKADVPASTIKDKQVLSALPAALPQSALASLVQALPVPDNVKAGLAQALPRLSNPVPLTYTYESTSTYWVEPTTGLVVDTDREEIRKGGIAGPGGVVLASVPVYDVTTAYTSQSVSDATKEASDKKNSLQTFGTTLPWIFGIVGVVALVAGLVLALTGRRGRPAAAPAGTVPTGGTYPPSAQGPPSQPPPTEP